MRLAAGVHLKLRHRQAGQAGLQATPRQVTMIATRGLPVPAGDPAVAPHDSLKLQQVWAPDWRFHAGRQSGLKRAGDHYNAKGIISPEAPNAACPSSAASTSSCCR